MGGGGNEGAELAIAYRRLPNVKTRETRAAHRAFAVSVVGGGRNINVVVAEQRLTGWDSNEKCWWNCRLGN